MTYQIFKRKWWKDNPEYDDGLEPHTGKKKDITTVETLEEAKDYCQKWNASHTEGRYGEKAEFVEIK
ncbi:unnamed protein product [marine sediment metagenome]|uniref:Uncharacterized protein n=1 Tax=marine sediment metagenome TaxID=412755 RepID=X0UIK4_9ZZZZ